MRLPLLPKVALLIFILFLQLGLNLSPLHAKDIDGGGESGEKVSSPGPQKATFVELYSWTTILPKELIDLENGIDQDNELKKVGEELPKLSGDTEQIRWDVTIALTNPEIEQPQITIYYDRVQRLTARLKKMSASITSSITALSGKRKSWMEKKEQIEELEKNEELQLLVTVEQQKKLSETIDKAVDYIEKTLKRVISIGQKIGDLQIVLYSVEADLRTLDQEMKSMSIQKNAPSMLSTEFYSQINFDLIKQSYGKTRRYAEDIFASLQANVFKTFAGCLGFILICLIIRKTRHLVPSSFRWHSFAECPVATAVFITISLLVFIGMLPFNVDLLQQWLALLRTLALLAVIRLIRFLVVDKDRQNLLRILTFFVAVTQFLMLLGMPHFIILLYVFYVSIVAIVYYFYHLYLTRGKRFSGVWIKWLWGIFPAMVLFSGIAGYDQLAIKVFSTLLFSVIACLFIWMLYMFHLGLLELTIFLVPSLLIKENISYIVDALKPIIAWLHILFLVAAQGVIWDFYPTFLEALNNIFNLGVDLAGLHLSAKFIFTIVIVFYGALLISRAVQVVLLRKILPRYKVEQRGVQLSITRLVHYAVLTVGFFIMLKVLGFQLSQLTLLGGALGVGIGFGLQAVVNNFVSGLILLFERPVKVGDTIQIGTDYGEVKQLGLRATIIQSFDNAEIVVPNSDLITGQVTNWTLADRKVRVKIPVGVAYGTDVAKVLEILIGCGKANPMVLDKPQPTALFLAFGASSLDFELRVWIPEFLDKLQVLSDLNQDIDSEFSLNGIEIPFPQTDLHLRTVEDAAGAILRGEKKSVIPAPQG